MATFIDTDVLYSKQLEAYITNCDHRIRAGFRVALEALGISVPDYAARQPSGPKPGLRIAAAFAADAAIHGDNTYTQSGKPRVDPRTRAHHLDTRAREAGNQRLATGCPAHG